MSFLLMLSDTHTHTHTHTCTRTRTRTRTRTHLEAVEEGNLLKGLKGRRQPAVHAEDSLVDHGGHGQKVKEVRELAPHHGRPVPLHALAVEAVYLRDLPRLVVAAEERDARLASSQKSVQTFSKVSALAYFLLKVTA